MSDFESKVGDAVQKTIIRSKQYIGLNDYAETALDAALQAVLLECGTDVFFNMNELRRNLEAHGAGMDDINRVCLLCNVTSFRELIEKNNSAKQLDIDRFVFNAVRQTGLTRSTIMKITSSILTAVGIAPAIEPQEEKLCEKITAAYTIPFQYYQNELGHFREEYDRWITSGIEPSQTGFERLRALAEANIPEAKFYMGDYLLRRCQMLSEDSISPQYDIALELLESAAEAGHSRAACTVADCYYNGIGVKKDWSRAFSYYTGYGSASLSQSSREAFVNIVNHRRYNKKILLLNAVLVALIIALVAIAPGFPLYSRLATVGIVTIILCLAAFGVALMHYRAEPYSFSFNALAPVLFGIWAFYTAIRILA